MKRATQPVRSRSPCCRRRRTAWTKCTRTLTDCGRNDGGWAREMRAHLTSQLAWLDQEFDNEILPAKALFHAEENDSTVPAVPQVGANGSGSVPEITANAAQSREDA